ncbi:MAG: class I SAM-dependent methyltransferase [Ignavibacteriae bacterium]|nr:class I SAM-dependent methyltransferase [Ignavibacteriota bacterium]NOG96420.1 class I SAM-dependent methyltransferase [Ignavibacteriota bacterium]
MTNKEFYNRLADFYDSMIDFESAIERRKDLLKPFTADKTTALDLGCGTGIDSISLSKLGLIVDAVDQSEGMVERAKLNGEKFNAKINFSVSGIKEFNPDKKKYDLILSLGNSLANNSESELKEILNSISQHLTSKGSLLIQILNFKLLPESGHFSVNKKESDSLFINRYYEIENGIINFIIDFEDKINSKKGSIKTEIFPHTKELFQRIFDPNKFNVEFFGGLNKSEFDLNESKDLVILATKK